MLRQSGSAMSPRTDSASQARPESTGLNRSVDHRQRYASSSQCPAPVSDRMLTVIVILSVALAISSSIAILG
jgi:hypothetical protein